MRNLIKQPFLPWDKVLMVLLNYLSASFKQLHQIHLEKLAEKGERPSMIKY